MSSPPLLSLPFSHWQSAPALDAQAILYCALYVFAARRVKNWPAHRGLCFIGGVVAVLLALQSGLDTYDNRLLSVHMVQHMVLLLIAPLLLLCGRPVLLTLRALPPDRRGNLARALARMRVLTGPIQCLAVFYVVVLLWHLPALYDATLSNSALHGLEHALFLFAGLMLWWPVLDADPVQAQRISGLGRLIYVIAAMPPMALVGAYLNRHTPLVYPSYAAPARALGVSPLVDQANAGAIMWVLGDVIMVAVGLWTSLRTLVAEERRQQLREARAR
jgi:putative membrane protein